MANIARPRRTSFASRWPTMALSLFAVATLIQGCLTSEVDTMRIASYRERTQSEANGDLRTTVAVPTAAEAKAIYGADLAARGIQPVWIEIKNGSAETYWMLDSGVDSNNFSASEVAYAFGGAKNKQLRATLDSQRFQNPIQPGETTAGFVLTNLDENIKMVQVDLIARGDFKTFSFNVTDPTAELTSTHVDLANLYAPRQIVEIDSEEELRDALQRLPCCTTNRDATNFGDPLNLVLVGERDAIISALLRRHWDPTESLRSTSLWRTIGSFLSRTRYRSSPISPLYVFGRRQDGSAQKARATIHERNHARFWLTPIRYQNTPVWIGQISRDIGVKYTLKSPTFSTHVIDPDVDEARSYFAEDMAYSQTLKKFGYVAGVGAVPRDTPRFNLVGDPYFTDGLRAVLFMSGAPHALDQIGLLDWEGFSLRNPSRTLKVAAGIDENDLRERAVVKKQDRIQVATAVPNDAQNQAIFGVDLVTKSIQPLWLEITNRSDRAFVFLPTGLDPEYFSPREAAFLFRDQLGGPGYRALADHLESISLNSRLPIRPGETASGFIYANRVVPTISAAVDLIGENWSERINLLVPVPGTETVQRRLEQLAAIGKNQATKTVVDDVALRRALEALPCCATTGDGTTDGPPLNLIVIGDPGDVISSFARSLYRYRPVFPLRAFGREQDLSAKKISRWVAPKPLVIHGWLAPLRFRGKPVLILQVSIPRGGRFGPVAGRAEDIDPRVDDARDAVIQELLYSQSVSKLGFVRGASSIDGGFPTDGLRAVVVIDAKPISLSHVDFFDWERLDNVSIRRSEHGK